MKDDEPGVPIRLLVHLVLGVLLGTCAGWLVGSIVPGVFIGAVHVGFHGGWFAGLVSYVAMTRGTSGASGRTLAECVVIGAVLLGGIGFVLGFYGPLYFMPGANLGPLLGIFVTGPLGFLTGAFGGWLWHGRLARLRERRTDTVA